MPGWVLAIDFGTSYSSAAIAQDGTVTLVEIARRRTIPSGVWVDDAGSLVVGTSAERQGRLAPERWERAPKRYLGEPSPLLLGDTQVQVVEAVAAILRMLAAEAVRQQGSQPDEVRLTCPAQWGERRRGALKVAAQLAGLGPPTVPSPPRLVEEPVAAALYFADRGELPLGRMVAVYDLGGGTFDAAVLEATAQGFVVRAVGGVDGVGGERFDALLYAHVGSLLADRDPAVWQSLRQPPDARWRRAGEELLREVRRGKEELSDWETVTLDTGPLIDIPLQLQRSAVEAVLRPAVEQTAEVFADTIARAGCSPADLAAVYLAGGASRMPLVEQVVSARLGVASAVLGEPKSVVVLGGARWSEGAEAPGGAATTKPVPSDVATEPMTAPAELPTEGVQPTGGTTREQQRTREQLPPDEQETRTEVVQEVRRSRRTPVLLAGGAAALVVAGVLALVLTGGNDPKARSTTGGSGTGSGTGSSSTGSSSTGTSSGTSSGTTGTSSGTTTATTGGATTGTTGSTEPGTLSADEQALADRLQMIAPGSCSSFDSSFGDATVRCDPLDGSSRHVSSLFVTQFGTLADLNEFVSTEERDFPVGQCPAAPTKNSWNFTGPPSVGRIFCQKDDPLVLWTYTADLVVVEAYGDTTPDAFAWWRATNLHLR